MERKKSHKGYLDIPYNIPEWIPPIVLDTEAMLSDGTKRRIILKSSPFSPGEAVIDVENTWGKWKVKTLLEAAVEKWGFVYPAEMCVSDTLKVTNFRDIVEEVNPLMQRLSKMKKNPII